MVKHHRVNGPMIPSAVSDGLGLALGLAFALTLAATMSTATAAAAEGVQLTTDGFLVRDGRPHFIIGMYESTDDDDILRDMADHGVSLVRVSANVESLDRAHKHGLSTWIPLGSRLALPENAGAKRQALTETIETFKDHPALLSWEAADEALWNVWWGRRPWFAEGQSAALKTHIAAAEQDHPSQQIDQWTARLEKANEYSHRGLWQQGDALYETLWNELKIENPHPDWKMSLAKQQARELGAQLTRGWQHIRKIDAKHVLWQNHAPRNSIAALRWHNREVDAAGCDIYPVPFNRGVGHSDLTDMNLTAVGAYTDRMRAAAPGKAVWMVLQGFGWNDIHQPAPHPEGGRRPNLRETRFMAYDAIVHGANAILYWGTHAIEKESELWRQLMSVTAQIRALEPAIVGQRPEQAPTAVAEETSASVDGQGPRLMLRKTDDDWVLIVVNEVSTGIAFAVDGLPPELNGRALYRLYSDESHQVEDGRFRDGIRSLDVHVYASSRRFEVKKMFVDGRK